MQLYGVRGWGSAIAEGVLALAGRPYEFVDVTGFDSPGPTRDRLMLLNPLAQVPTLLLDDGTVLTETAAMALYFLPLPADRVHYLRLLTWLVANVYPTFTYGDYPARWTPSAPAELVASTDAYREKLYLWLEDQVAAPYALGSELTALDIYIAVMINWRPRRAWFNQHTPRLAAIADQTRRVSSLASELDRNVIPPSAA